MTTLINTLDSVPPPRPIRFVHNQGQPPSKRRRITAACLTCRKRKTKCAGERPLCSTCTKNGHHCLGYPEENRKEEGEKHGMALRTEVDERDRELQDLADDEENIKPHKSGLGVKLTEAPVPSRVPDAALLSKATEPDDEAPGVAAHVHQPIPQPGHSVAREPLSSTAVRRSESNRVPYFRYFGPTAIVPGFKQMVVSVRDRRRSTAGSISGTSPLSTHSGVLGNSSAPDSDVVMEDLPVYDPNDAAPVHHLIINLVKTFFVHLGSSFPFLKEQRFLRMVKEKRVESILVDSVCSLAARFSDLPALTGGNDKMPRTERGVVFAQRARQATVDTFPCPTVGAVQAFLLMAYEGFGASQDSALWMYLGLAIRMAVDLGLQKEVGVQYQGEKDPLYINWSRKPGDEESSEGKEGELSPPDPKEQKEVVQERIDTFWGVFILDRFISSGTGRPVTIRDDDFELTFPEPAIDSATGWPAPFPIFLQIINLYGRVCDVLNNVRDAQDLTEETWDRLGEMEHELTQLYKSWDWRLQFNVSNFKAYLGVGQGTTFILLHFWFHALFIVLHQPTLLTPFAELRTELQLVPDSRELSMSSAKTICDILSFADLIDPKSFIGDPFTNQPIYIAACAFLMESCANAPQSPSRTGSPTGFKRPEQAKQGKSSRHSLLASAANQNYQRCYNSLQQVQMYWGGVKYILTTLDQKSKGIWDCETYTSEEYESTKLPRRDSKGNLNPFPRFENQASPKVSGPPIAWSLAGTANSPSSSLTLMYQNRETTAVPAQPTQPPRHTSTPPGNMVYDPIRQSLPEPTLLPPPYSHPTSAARQTPRQQSNMSGRPMVKFDPLLEDGDGTELYTAPRFTPTNQQSNGYEAYSGSPPSTMAENGMSSSIPTTDPANLPGATQMYYPSGGVPYQMPWAQSMGNMDSITFNIQDIDIGALGLQQPELMGPWLEYIPGDVLGLFEEPDMGQGP
ncbi:fungal-specific transcription factor domain-containing protein [Dactylonectria macrodidyma]|uniref:Fungal-specific transcription factor domain-containing protein n=1 Tax=Dactylonectria macrodidyma TaxID=307937 RepID=A0A9P9F2M1_9HYPO|nr:fungal-specific transcription factor domain-containing protein [Dactylonectria macrodidyma]